MNANVSTSEVRKDKQMFFKKFIKLIVLERALKSVLEFSLRGGHMVRRTMILSIIYFDISLGFNMKSSGYLSL